MLESLIHGDKCFVTLTYTPETLPTFSTGPGGPLVPTLRPKDLQLFLKRLRETIKPKSIRFYAVGEYGDETERPHYHLALFGYPTCLYGYTDRRLSGPCDCVPCSTLQRVWSLGLIHNGTLELHSAQYVAKYVTKKMTGHDDKRLNGRHPEFARMSLRPGIGANALWDVASVLLEYNLDVRRVDVPTALSHGRLTMPLGRYLRGRLRTLIGKDHKAPDEALAEIQKELQPLREAAFSSSSSFQQAIIDANKGRRAQVAAKMEIYKSRGNI